MDLAVERSMPVCYVLRCFWVMLTESLPNGRFIWFRRCGRVIGGQLVVGFLPYFHWLSYSALAHQYAAQLLMAGNMGVLVGVLGAFLIMFPGFVTTALGLVLQIPQVQKQFAGISGSVWPASPNVPWLVVRFQVWALVWVAFRYRCAVSCGAGNPFAGMQQMQPDTQVRDGNVSQKLSKKKFR